MEDRVLAWHFIGKDGLTSVGKLPVVVGQVQEFTGTPILCEQGLHWSIDILDAVRHAQGTEVCRVEAWGGIVLGSDKGCSNFRLPLWRLDIENILHEFACDEAERAMKLADWTDKRSWDATEAKRRWLRGEITAEELKAFRRTADAARADAAYAARAAGAAAGAAYDARAAYAARIAAARIAAARAAAYAARADAARANANAGAYAAAKRQQYRAEQNQRLEQLALEAYKNTLS